MRIAAKEGAEIKTGTTCREIGTETIKGADVGEEGTIVVDGIGGAAVMTEAKRGGKTGAITVNKSV